MSTPGTITRPPRTKPRHRWRRRFLWCVAIALGARLGLALAMPWLVNFGASFVGCTATYRSATLSVLGLSLHLEDLVMRDAAAPADEAPLLVAQEITADVSSWQLLHGQLAVVDAALSGCSLHVVRNADGSLRLPAAMLPPPAPAKAPIAPAEPAPSTAATEVLPPFELPLRIASARVSGLQIHCRDETSTPARDYAATIDVDVADIGRPDGPLHLTVRAESPGLLDRLHLQGNATTSRDHLELDWQLTVRGVHLTELPLPKGTLDPLGKVRDGDFDVGGSVTVERAPDSGSLAGLTGELLHTLQLDATERLRVRASLGPLQRTGEQLAAPLTAELHCPDLVDHLLLQQGEVRFAPAQADLSGTLAGRGITLRSLAPMLEELGITLADGGLEIAAQLAASVPLRPGSQLAARLQDLVVRHGDERLDLALLHLTGVQADANGATIDRVEITGPNVRLRREPDGALAIAGLRLRPAPADSRAVPPPSQTPAAGPTACPAVRIRRVDWHDGAVHFTDASLPDSPGLAVADLKVEAEELAFGVDQPPGRATASLSLPDNVASLRAQLRVRPNAHGAAGDLQLEATGITAKGLVPWLRGAGIEPVFTNGSLGVAISGDVTIADGAFAAAGRLANLRLQDAGAVLLSVRNIELQGLRSDATGLDLGSARLDEPHLVVEQWPEGRLRLAGLQFGPATPAGVTPPNGTKPPNATNRRPAAEPETPTPARTGGSLRTGPVSLQSAQITFRDRRADPRDLQLGVSAELGPYRGNDTPTTFQADLRLDQAIESLQLRGEFQATNAGLQLAANVAGKGLHGDQLSPLLPANLRSTLSSGSVQAQLALTTHTLANATALDLTAQRIALHDRDEELLAIDRVELHAPTLSPLLVHIASLQVDGVRALAAQTPEGLAVPGFLIRPTPIAAPPLPATDQAAPPDATANGRPAVAREIGQAMPSLRIDALRVAVERLRFRDRVLGESTPLELGARLELDEPWATSKDLVDTPAARLSCTVTAAPLCSELRLDTLLQPFLLTPTLDVRMVAAGIDPTAIARVLPTLGERIGGTTANATLTAHVHAFLDLRRRDPGRFDLSRPFGAQIVIEDVQLRDAGSDTSLLSIPSIDVLARSIDPATGNVLLKTVDIDGPVLHLARTQNGIECGGLVLRSAPAAAAPPTPTPPPLPLAEATKAPPEFSIDRLRVQGLSFDFRDTLTSPVTHLPLRDLDLDLQNFSTEALREPRSFTFQLTMRGGDVELPRRLIHSSVVAGLLGSTATALGGGADQHEIERRPLFQEMVLTGQMQVYPLARGTCSFDLTGFEVPAMRGLANLGGVVLNDGLVDASMKTTSRGPAGTKVKSDLTFTWLSISEPPNGPISTYLKLPAPLDTVLWVLRNDADEQRIPMQVEFPAQGISPVTIRDAAVESLTLLIGKAIGSAPLRAAGAVTGLLGLSGTRSDLPQLVTTVKSQPGATDADFGALAKLLAATADDPEVKFVLHHELGAGDLERAAALANPPEDVVRATIARLRARRAELSATRGELAVAASTLYAAGSHDAAAARTRLLAVDTELGQVEVTLDKTLAMFDGDSRHTRDRNTRRAAINLGSLRLEAVRAALLARLPPGSADRIELRPARAVGQDGLPAGGQVVITPRPRQVPNTVVLQRDGTERTFERH